RGRAPGVGPARGPAGRRRARPRRRRPARTRPRRVSAQPESLVAADAILDERRTTPVELLWDLVFVFAVTQVTALLAKDLSWAGLGRGMLVLALVWWAWAANAQDTGSPTLRLALLLAMVLVFVAGLALPHAFDDEAPVFAITYAAVR